MSGRSVRKYMFYCENGSISVLKHSGNSLEFMKRDGEIEFPISVDFWEWWRKASSFLSGDSIDFCFVYDREYDFLSDEFYKNLDKVEPGNSVWSIKFLKHFFWELKPTYFNVDLIDQNGNHYQLNDGLASSAATKHFHTTFTFSEQNEMKSAITEDENIPDDKGEVSSIAKYFIDLIRKERGFE